MTHDHTSDEPSADERIVPAPRDANPGTEDGVGEHVLEGMGHDGVRRIDGEFADLGAVAPTQVAPATIGVGEASTTED